MTFCRLPHTRETAGVDVACVGIPFDSDSNNRTGARYGPRAVREATHDFIREFNPRLGVWAFQRLSVVDAGDTPIVPGETKASFDRIEEALRPVFAAGIAVVAVGGDHAVSLPHLRAAASEREPLSLLLFDAHTDVADEWMTRYNHGTQFRRAVEEGLIDPASSIMVGINGPIYADMRIEEAEALGFAALSAEDVIELGPRETAARIRERVGESEVFLSFDVDVMEAAFAPGSGALEIGGLLPREVLAMFKLLAGINLRAADIVEVNPLYDPTRVTAALASNVLYNILGLIALRDRPLSDEARADVGEEAAATP